LDEGGVEPVGSITLPVSFGSPGNARTKFIIFDIVDMHYPYNAIFGRDLLNTFKAALHSAYLCLKVPASLGVISFHDSQKDAKNIEQGFTPGHKNVHFLREPEVSMTSVQQKTKLAAEAKQQLKLNATQSESR
jgi:hypothetical protein